MPANTKDDEPREITIGESADERLGQLAWEHELPTDEIAKRCIRYGLRNYERALAIERY